MKFRCRFCGSQFHDTDQNRSQQREGQCPICGHNVRHGSTSVPQCTRGTESQEDIQQIKPKVCPVLSMGRDEPQFCIHESCASWNDYFQMCTMSIPGFLNAQEEQKAKRL